MVPMGALQPGLPSPVAIPRGFFKLVIDLKDCFFCIPLHPKDSKRFAFSLPIINQIGPSPRFQWRVLPQGMANSPTLCQKYVAQAVDPLRLKYPFLYIIHYMDDILLAGPYEDQLSTITQELVHNLTTLGLKIAPEEIQKQPPFLFLGFELGASFIYSQKVKIRQDTLHTLNDFQRLLGDINWLRPYLKLTTGDLKPLFDILRGDSDPSSPRKLSQEAAVALHKVDVAISQQSISYYHPSHPFSLLIFPSPFSPTGLLWQDRSLFWLHLPASPSKVLPTYPSLVASLIQQGREAATRLFGQDPHSIITPYTTT